VASHRFPALHMSIENFKGKTLEYLAKHRITCENSVAYDAVVPGGRSDLTQWKCTLRVRIALSSYTFSSDIKDNKRDAEQDAWHKAYNELVVNNTSTFLGLEIDKKPLSSPDYARFDSQSYTDDTGIPKVLSFEEHRKMSIAVKNLNSRVSDLENKLSVSEYKLAQALSEVDMWKSKFEASMKTSTASTQLKSENDKLRKDVDELQVKNNELEGDLTRTIMELSDVREECNNWFTSLNAERDKNRALSYYKDLYENLYELFMKAKPPKV